MQALCSIDTNIYNTSGSLSLKIENDSPWHVVYCSGGRDIAVRDGLAKRGFEVFVPFERVTRKRKTRRGVEVHETKDIPVFAGYAFVKSDAFIKIEQTPGVLCMVKLVGRPLVVPTRVVELLRRGTDATGMVREKDITKLSFSFGGEIGDQFSFKRSSPLHGFMGRIGSLASLDETGNIEAWVQMLGSERLISVPHNVVSLNAKPSEGLGVDASPY